MSNGTQSEVINEVDVLREKIKGSRNSFRDQGFLDELAQQITDAPNLGRLPIARALAEDLRAYTPGSRLACVKAHINEGRDNHILSLFDASYFPRCRWST